MHKQCARWENWNSNLSWKSVLTWQRGAALSVSPVASVPFCREQLYFTRAEREESE